MEIVDLNLYFCKARHILMNGCRWRIGNEASNVMSDPWLRGEEGAWLPSPQDQGVHNLNVIDLMMPHMKVWDKGKIESLFPMHVANCILDIPLLYMLGEDKLVWVGNTHGQYSVKSSYMSLLNVTGKMNEVSQQEDWHSLWSIRAPPKAKHLLWRISKRCLPTRLRLQEKYVPYPLSCPLCNYNYEDDWHVFFSCDVSIEARIAAGLEHILQPQIQHASNVQELIHSVCKNEDTDMAGIFAMLMWVLWHNRNNKVWNDVNEPGRNLGLKARHLWDEWNSVQLMQQSRRTYEQQQQHDLCWQKPPLGWYKCNVDAGFHKELNKTSMGWCLRDHLGRFVLAETTWLEGNCTIVEGESLIRSFASIGK